MTVDPFTESEGADIVCVFVCHFHVKKGNLIEWSSPTSFDLKTDAVEFKCLPSGSHLVKRDTVFFKVGDHFAVSHLKNVHIDEQQSNSDGKNLEDERGTRMRAIGFVCKSVLRFQKYAEFLTRSEDVSRLYESVHNDPDAYEILQSYAKEQKEPVPSGLSYRIPYSPNYGFFSLIEDFGVKLLVLWKLSLLNLRILFYSSPPLEKLCNQLYPLSIISRSSFKKNFCVSQLSQTSSSETSEAEDDFLDVNKFLFYVSLLDLSANRENRFSEGSGYMACTSDKVAEESMKSCYDIFVDGTSIRSWRRDLASLLKPSKADQTRLTELKGLQLFHSEYSPEEIHETFAKYFIDLNNGIFKTLNESCEGDNIDGSHMAQLESSGMVSSTVGEISSAHVSQMGLLPNSGDMDFVQEVAAHFDLNVVVVKDGGCCPIFTSF